MTLKEGLRNLADAPVFDATLLTGIRDTPTCWCERAPCREGGGPTRPDCRRSKKELEAAIHSRPAAIAEAYQTLESLTVAAQSLKKPASQARARTRSIGLSVCLSNASHLRNPCGKSC